MHEDRFYTGVSDMYDEIFPFSQDQLEFVLEHMQHPESARILEVGCGTGSLTSALTASCGTVAGVDLNEAMIRKAQEKQRGNGRKADYRKLDMRELSRNFPHRYFDAVVSFGNTLVHLSDQDEILNVLKEMKLLLKPAGALMLQIINYDRILDQGISELPTIENENIRFERRYVFLDADDREIEPLVSRSPDEVNRIRFRSRLTVKASGFTSDQEVRLYPLRKRDFAEMLLSAGFADLKWYGGFNCSPLHDESLPLIVSARA